MYYLIMVEFYPLTNEQEQFLKDIYYNKKLLFGRDKLYKYISKNHPEQKITRRQIADFLSNQEVQQLYRNKPTVKASRPLITQRKTLQIDLIDLNNISSSNNRYSYILNCIDIFSRKVWLFKLLKKTNTSVKSFVIPLLKQHKFKVLSSDNGLEFTGFDEELKEIGVKHIYGNPYTPQNQAVIERSNGTIKKVINKLFFIRKNKKWIDILQEVEDNYNTTVNRNLNGKTPNEAFIQTDEEQSELIQKNTERIKKSQKYSADISLPIGTLVRIIDNKPKIKSDATWSNVIYKIEKVIKPKNNTLTRKRYRLLNIDTDTLLKGNYNITQIQVIKKSQIPPPTLKIPKQNTSNIRKKEQLEIESLEFEKRELPKTKLRKRI